MIGGLRYDQKELFFIHIITQYYAVKEKRDKFVDLHGWYKSFLLYMNNHLLWS